MKEKLALTLVWGRIVVLSLFALFALAVVVANVKARIEPGLYVPFTSMGLEKPNAVAALLLTSILSVGLFYLGLTLYRAFRELKRLRETERLVKAESELAELKGRAEPSPAPAPIPLAGAEGDDAGDDARRSSGP